VNKYISPLPPTSTEKCDSYRFTAQAASTLTRQEVSPNIVTRCFREAQGQRGPQEHRRGAAEAGAFRWS